jgi:hypothetical protein
VAVVEKERDKGCGLNWRQKCLQYSTEKSHLRQEFRHGFYTIYPTFLVVFTLPYQDVQVMGFEEAKKTLLLQI